MTLLRLASGASLPLSASSLRCAQCHQSRYDAWVSGTHGFPAFVEGRPNGVADGATTCAPATIRTSRALRLTLLSPTPRPPLRPPPLPGTSFSWWAYRWSWWGVGSSIRCRKEDGRETYWAARLPCLFGRDCRHCRAESSPQDSVGSGRACRGWYPGRGTPAACHGWSRYDGRSLPTSSGSR